MLWYGSIASIPSGWHLCDGTMGTPNLDGKFIRGAGVSYSPGTVSGNLSHSHSFTGDGHDHDIPGGVGLATGTDFYLTTTSEPSVGDTDDEYHLPLNHQLCYIMKL